MKKTTMGIGVFMVLFLVVAAYTAQAQVTDLNGTWLKFTGTMKGKVFADGPGSAEEGKNDDGSIKLYGCVVDSPVFFDNQFFVQVYEKQKTAIRAGAAVFQKSAGTEDKFAGWFSMKLMEGYIPADPSVYSTSASAPGKMTIKKDKIDFKGFGGQAEKVGGNYTGYALYGVKLNAKTVTAKNLPFNEATACPAGYVIHVKNTDDGDHSGTISPAGPWVDVTTGFTQVFIVTVNTSGTYVKVYKDNVLIANYDDVSPSDIIPPITIDSDGSNHSVRVDFD
jgi:hypothetical protein